LTFTDKYQRNDDSILYQSIQNDVDMVNPVGGETQFEIDEATTATWEARTVYFDVLWELPSGGGTFTFLTGSFRVKEPLHTP